ncbi:GH12906 [Drosophila grimshawi]|uniref:GH12906 n=1 Tax=Drosophila grimshawi TaxID=7222 RepID=B4JIS4_DROGR|nr:GH12906 [Drosophila grimshawi]
MISNTGRPQALLLLGLLICAYSCGSTCARPSGVKLQSQYLRAIGAYRRLERSLPRQELRALTGLGLLNGARQAEEQMEQHLVQAIKELLQQSADIQQHDASILPKIDAIEQQMTRDQRSLSILSSAMEVLSNDKNEQQFRKVLKDLLRQQQQKQLQQQQQSLDLQQSEEQPESVTERLGQLRLSIMQQVPQMKSQLDAKIERALDHLIKYATVDGPLAKASHKMLHKRSANELEQDQQPQPEPEPAEKQDPEEMRVIKSILSEDDFRENLVIEQYEKNAGTKRQTQANDELDELDNASQNVTVETTTITKARQDDEDKSTEIGGDNFGDEGNGGNGGNDGNGGGLVGIIGSLSGGEGGSDVGALIGALTGLISTLFGPGGLDIEALISTGTSLISGLLSGNKNFGVVLGQYVGTAFDGLSGGGGAINNGLFVGNFVGTVLAALSADPEEEGLPQPLTFTKNFLSGFLESKFRPVEASEERHGSAGKKKKESAGGGFDSGGFVKQIASHLVSSALGLLLNASLGASGGASHASTGLFSSSSHHMKPAVH